MIPIPEDSFTASDGVIIPSERGWFSSMRLPSGSAMKRTFLPSCRSAWRWAWKVLKPRVSLQDIDVSRRSLVDMLSSVVIEDQGRTGIPNYIDAISKDLKQADRRAVLGFTGKNLEAARFLLREAELDPTSRGQRLRRQGESIIATILKLRMAPPEGEGIDLDNGLAVCGIPRDRQVYLRSFGDDVKAALLPYEREQKGRREHRVAGLVPIVRRLALDPTAAAPAGSPGHGGPERARS